MVETSFIMISDQTLAMRKYSALLTADNKPYWFYLALVACRVWSVFNQMTIPSLIFVLTSTAQQIYKELGKRAEALAAKSSEMEEAELSAELENWRKGYELVCRFVDTINDNFGLLILFNLVWLFYNGTSKLYELLIIGQWLFSVYWRYDLKAMSDKLSEMSLPPLGHNISQHYKNIDYKHFLLIQSAMDPILLAFYYFALLMFLQLLIRSLAITIPSNRMRKEVLMK